MRMNKNLALGLVVVFAAVGGGCQNLARPNLLHPGTAEEQQKRAIRYDPYPQADMGPATTNVRPKAYDKPISEASQARWFLNGW
jgi:hypothetical protein